MIDAENEFYVLSNIIIPLGGDDSFACCKINQCRF
jgi:hypothetical protein